MRIIIIAFLLNITFSANSQGSQSLSVTEINNLMSELTVSMSLNVDYQIDSILFNKGFYWNGELKLYDNPVTKVSVALSQHFNPNMLMIILVIENKKIWENYKNFINGKVESSGKTVFQGFYSDVYHVRLGYWVIGYSDHESFIVQRIVNYGTMIRITSSERIKVID